MSRCGNTSAFRPAFVVSIPMPNLGPKQKRDVLGDSRLYYSEDGFIRTALIFRD